MRAAPPPSLGGQEGETEKLPFPRQRFIFRALYTVCLASSSLCVQGGALLFEAVYTKRNPNLVWKFMLRAKKHPLMRPPSYFFLSNFGINVTRTLSNSFSNDTCLLGTSLFSPKKWQFCHFCLGLFPDLFIAWTGESLIEVVSREEKTFFAKKNMTKKDKSL